MKNLVMVTVLVGFGGMGCGDKSPAEKCQDLVSSVCDRAVECIPGASAMHDDCVRAGEGELSCSATKSVGKSYDECVDLLNQQSCRTLFPTDARSGAIMFDLPEACFGVLSTEAGHGNPGSVPGASTLTANPLGSLAARARAAIE
jgi:hypothetical protein